MSITPIGLNLDFSALNLTQKNEDPEFAFGASVEASSTI